MLRTQSFVRPRSLVNTFACLKSSFDVPGVSRLPSDREKSSRGKCDPCNRRQGLADYQQTEADPGHHRQTERIAKPPGAAARCHAQRHQNSRLHGLPAPGG